MPTRTEIRLAALESDPARYTAAEALAAVADEAEAADLLIEADSPAKAGFPRGIVRMLDADESRRMAILVRAGAVVRDPQTGGYATTPAGEDAAALY